MKHSPGPWRDVSDEPSKSRRPMAMVNVGGEGRMCVDCTDSGKNFAQDLANARLIAAAPDLLAALIRFVEPQYESRHDNDAELIEQARAAIEKATK
jgi:hypothetical protein